MEPESKNRNNTKNHSIVSVSKKTFSQEKSEKSRLLKRFLNWIARGTDESHIGKTSCPT